MANPTNKKEFKDYIWRRMGYPLIPISVSDEQAYDRIDDALLFFRDYHSDATEDLFFAIQITDQDKANKYLTIPERIIGITNVMEASSSSNIANFMNTQYQASYSAYANINSGASLVPYYLAMSAISELNFMFSSTPGMKFNRHTDRLYINWNWNEKLTGSYVVIHCYGYLEETTYTDLWNDRWLKEYAFNLIKKQHGENLKLTGGIQLLGGITINGDSLWNEADAKIQDLEQNLIKNTSLPPLDMIG